MKTALIVRHVEREGAAGYLAPMEAAGYAIERLNIAEPGAVDVDLNAPDLLVVMGGPMGVHDTQQSPWIAPEIASIAARLDTGRPTLGICLGAQMIAAALGARVYTGPAPEVGFHPVALNDVASPVDLIADVPVLHWHGDTFNLPEGTELLASTPAYRHQAFRRGPNLLALQFHAEMGEDPRFALWLEHFRDDFGCCPHREARLRADHDLHGPAAVAAGRAMIAAWLDQLHT